MNMEYSCIGLNDLPDEILMIIFQKLNNIDVLYSIQGVNQRLNKIIYDQIFTSRLTFVKWLSNDFIDLFHSDMMLNRFCLKILPEIHDKINWLDLESSSMKHILHATNYPNLDTLGLYNIDEESARSLFTDKILSSRIFKNQITTLIITFCNLQSEKIFYEIFTVFTCLITLVVIESSYKNCIRVNFDIFESPNIHCSTLLKLHINVHCFDDCLYLLDGRFNQLQTLYIDVGDIFTTNDIPNQGSLPNLKCFYLSSNSETYNHNGTILSLLFRMTNLIELGLCLRVNVHDTFIDGNYLKTNIINHMLQLNQFTFSISSFMFIHNEMNTLLSTEDIQHTFIDFPNDIISYVEYLPETKRSYCHIYSYPSLMRYHGIITNNFPGGLFKYVRFVSLFDDYPFEHEFFLRIQKSFPFMESLSLFNHKSQNDKQSYQSNNDNRNLSLIEYSFLNQLIIVNAHNDYIEEFLFDIKTSFKNNIDLYIKYQSLEQVTENFTRDITRINCAKISKLYLTGQAKPSNTLEEYFPYAKIFYR